MLLIIYYVSILGINFILILYYYSNIRFQKMFIDGYYKYFVFVAIGSLLNGIDLIKINIAYISDIPFIILYTIRGFLCFKKNTNIDLKNNIKNYFGFFMTIVILYVIIINTYYNENIYIELTSWKYYPYYTIVSLFTFIYHPLIIYLLSNDKNKKIRNEYINGFIVLLLSYTLYLIDIYITNIINIKYFWKILCAYFVCVFYGLNIILHNFKGKRENSQNIMNNTTNNDIIIIEKILNDNNKIFKDLDKSNINNIYTKLYENLIND